MERKRWSSVALILSAMALGAISCTQASGTNQPIEVTNRVFFDYNGNGIQEQNDPAIPDIGLIYQPGGITCLTNEEGLGTVKVHAGSYNVSIDDPYNKFNYILTPETTTDIEDGLNVEISNNEEISIPLAQGFLTWPFPEYVSYYSAHFFETDDPTLDPLSFCEGGT